MLDLMKGAEKGNTFYLLTQNDTACKKSDQRWNLDEEK